MKMLDIVRSNLDGQLAQRAALVAELELIPATAEAEARSVTDAEQADFDAKLDKVKAIDAEADLLRARIGELEEVARRNQAATLAPTVPVRGMSDPFDVLRSTGGMSESDVRAALVTSNLRAIEHKIEDAGNQAHFEKTIKRHAADVQWAANILARSRPEYESGFAKMVTGREMFLTNEERTAMSVGTNANGGFLLPTHLDPTIIMTNSGSSNSIRQISRVVTLTQGTTWRGISSAGVTASWDGELVEVSDDSPTVGNPTITAYKAQSFVQASIEAFDDLAGLATDVMMMFADARDRLEGAAHATGSGSSQPWGIFTALDANTNVELTSTTAATIGEVDIHSVYRNVPVRWRNRGTWVMNPLYSLAIKRLGTAVSSSYSGDLTAAVSDRILGRPLVESDDAPTTQTTTALDNEIVFGDFSNYVIVDKPGSMSVEYIPHLFNTSNNLPDGRRGWYAYWRTGADSVNDLGFRLLQDKTSA